MRSCETAAYKEATNPSNDVSDNIVKLKSGVTEQQVADLQQYLAKTSSDRQTDATNNDGDATFDGLGNGQWIVFETDAPDAASTLAQPMILNLTMKNACRYGTRHVARWQWRLQLLTCILRISC